MIQHSAAAVCPVCSGSESREFFTARRQPAMLNRLHATQRDARHAAHVSLHFRGCKRCGFVWNAAFESAAIDYSPGYINDQAHSQAFQSHLAHVRDHLALLVGDVAGDIVEIGCGQGDFLRALCRLTGRRGIGFDPACEQSCRDADHVCIHPACFNAESARAKCSRPALIICRHVLEHLADPAAMLREVARLMQSATLLYIEVPCFEWIAAHATFFDLFHEHCSLFTPHSMRRMLANAGFKAIRIQPAFGGQYLAIQSRVDAANASAADEGDAAIPDFDAVGRTLREAREAWSAALRDQTSAHACLLWGAGAKGVSLVNHLHLDATAIAHLIDINPQKHGRFVPLTAQRVIGPSELATADPAVILVMNPTYLQEIRACVREVGVQADVRAIDGSPDVALHR